MFFGLISYSLYLWHWSIFEYFRLTFDEDFGIGMLGAVTMVPTSILISYLSWRFIEVPVRHAKMNTPDRIVVIGGVIALMMVSALAYIMLNMT